MRKLRFPVLAAAGGCWLPSLPVFLLSWAVLWVPQEGRAHGWLEGRFSKLVKSESETRRQARRGRGRVLSSPVKRAPSRADTETLGFPRWRHRLAADPSR